MPKKPATGDSRLRRRLQNITGEFIGVHVAEQLDRIEALKATYHHSIVVAQVAVLTDQRTWNFNCHAFAFGLHETEEFWTIRENQPAAWPTGTFVSRLLLPHLEPVPEGDQQPGDLIIYFCDRSVNHSGIVRERLIRSKWGSAHTWDHRVYEVPTSFGSTVRYFKRPVLSDVVAAYTQFAGQPNIALEPSARK
jgi:hypothetical protein